MPMREERRSSILVLLGKKTGKTETRGTVSNQMEKKIDKSGHQGHPLLERFV